MCTVGDIHFQCDTLLHGKKYINIALQGSMFIVQKLNKIVVELTIPFLLQDDFLMTDSNRDDKTSTKNNERTWSSAKNIHIAALNNYLQVKQ